MLGDVMPVVGSLIGAGVGAFAFLLAASLSLLTIAIAWFFYRPLLGTALLVVAGGGLCWLGALGKNRTPAIAAR